MKKKIQIAPSILSADFGRLNEDIKTVEADCDLLHVDVMDGHFVPNLTFGAPVVRCIKTKLPLSCHLMIRNPEDFLSDFVKAGAATITFHAEVVKDKSALIKKIHRLGVRAGISVNPETSVSALTRVLDEVDEVLVMSVHPGFGGQKFIEGALEKIAWLRKMRPDLDIAVDGGIDDMTAAKVVQAGANILVSGSYIFNSKNRKKAIASLRS